MWMSSWPHNGKPAFKDHDTEALAEAHAKQIVDSGIARVATAYRIVLPDEENQ